MIGQWDLSFILPPDQYQLGRKETGSRKRARDGQSPGESEGAVGRQADCVYEHQCCRGPPRPATRAPDGNQPLLAAYCVWPYQAGRGKPAAGVVPSEGAEYTIARLTTLYGPGVRTGLVPVLADGLRRNSLAARIHWPGQFSMLFIEDAVSLLLFLAEGSRQPTRSLFRRQRRGHPDRRSCRPASLIGTPARHDVPRVCGGWHASGLAAGNKPPPCPGDSCTSSTTACGATTAKSDESIRMNWWASNRAWLNPGSPRSDCLPAGLTPIAKRSSLSEPGRRIFLASKDFAVRVMYFMTATIDSYVPMAGVAA